MKKVINGKLYNTETAKCIDWVNVGNGKNDLNGYEETLYVTKKGNFFLHGEGWGKYMKPSPMGGYGYGESIIPITKKEAENWVEENCSAETFEELFQVEEA